MQPEERVVVEFQGLVRDDAGLGGALGEVVGRGGAGRGCLPLPVLVLRLVLLVLLLLLLLLLERRHLEEGEILQKFGATTKRRRISIMHARRARVK